MSRTIDESSVSEPSSQTMSIAQRPHIDDATNDGSECSSSPPGSGPSFLTILLRALSMGNA